MLRHLAVLPVLSAAVRLVTLFYLFNYLSRGRAAHILSQIELIRYWPASPYDLYVLRLATFLMPICNDYKIRA